MMARLPDGVTPAMAAGASDNIADAYRTVAYALEERPGASVLIAGNNSIPLYAVWWARTLGAGNVTLCSRDAALLERAAGLGATVEHVETWPKRFRTHAITVDCTGEAAGLAAVIRSTEAYGRCTSASIFFGGDTPVPMFDMNMKGIRFDTGRVNGAALMPTVLELIARHGLHAADDRRNGDAVGADERCVDRWRVQADRRARRDDRVDSRAIDRRRRQSRIDWVIRRCIPKRRSVHCGPFVCAVCRFAALHR